MTTIEANTKYTNLINHYLMNPPADNEYFELHHIVPRVIAPELINDKTNLVKLPYHAHVLAHLYYANSLNDSDKHKFGQINAVIHMLSVKNKKQNISEEFILEHAEELDTARAKFRELNRITHTGENNPMFGKLGEKNPMFGKQHSDETKQKMSEAKKGKNHPRYKPFIIDGIHFETQRDAAKYFDVSQMTICYWLHGKLKTDHSCHYLNNLTQSGASDKII